MGVSGWTGLKTNRKGFAVVSYIQAYRYNWMSFDIESIATDTEIDEISKVVVPHRGSIVKVAYSSTTVRTIQFTILDDSRKHIPLRAKVLDQNSKPVGLVDNQ
ncbi:fimbria/pilus outer membrane usher protein [Pseudomonas lurida]|uniref:fimbria/pilus outer membrane usher protein n=1 Tax=Pseudomonas lurida TaxID=244566 RepID=UPI0034E2F708